MFNVQDQTWGYAITNSDSRFTADIKNLPGNPYYAQGAWIIRTDINKALKPAIDKKVASLERKVRKVLNDDILNAPQQLGPITELPNLTLQLPIRRPLYDFQGYGVGYCYHHRRVIIGDQPGLGKTSQAAACCLIGRVDPDTSTLPALVICPATIKRKWQRELMEVAGLRAMILDDRRRTSWPYILQSGMVDAVIVNYESLSKYFVQGVTKGDDEDLRLHHIVFKPEIALFKTVIIDEIHRCKDYKTRQSKLVRGIAQGKEWILALTGTCVVNEPADLMAQLAIIDRLKDFGGWTYFKARYCSGDDKASNLAELNYKLTSTCFFRREKWQVLKDLPDKTRVVIQVDIDNREEYDVAEDRFLEYLKVWKSCSDVEIARKMSAQFMVQLSILREIAARGKIKAVQEWMDNLKAAGEKIIIFCNLLDIVRRIKALFPGSLEITGNVSSDDRDRYVTLFQTSNKHNEIICNIKAGGVGIDLFASSNVGFIEFPWHNADCEQCEDRAHRNGQKNAVTAAYFLGVKTVDEFIYQKIQDKKDISDQITGADDKVKEFVTSLINFINKSKSKGELWEN